MGKDNPKIVIALWARAKDVFGHWSTSFFKRRILFLFLASTSYILAFLAPYASDQSGFLPLVIHSPGLLPQTQIDIR